MATVLIVIHLMVVIAMIALVLLQRTEGGALGIGGGGGGISRRSSSNLLTKTTGVFAACFFATSIGLTALAKLDTRPTDIFERLPAQEIPTLPQAPVGGAETPGTGPGVLEALRGESQPQEPPAQPPEAPAGGLGPQQPPAPPEQ